MVAEKIFDSNGKEPMLIDVYFSGGASSVIDMIEKDPNYGKNYNIRFAFTNDEDASGIEKLIDEEITVIIRDHKKEYAKMHEQILDFNDSFDSNSYVKDWGDFETEDGRESFLKNACGRFYNNTLKDSLREHLREEYDRIVYESINSENMIKRYGSPNLVCLSGYMRILSDYFVDTSVPIINVHPAKLSIVTDGKETIDASALSEDEIKNQLGEDYHRLLTGDDAVTDAIKKRHKTLHSTIHIVDKTVDGGPILVTSPQVKIDLDNAEEMGLEQYADEVQDIMKDKCDSPAYFKALELIFTSKVSIDTESGKVLIDSDLTKYGGFLMDDIRWKIVKEYDENTENFRLKAAPDDDF